MHAIVWRYDIKPEAAERFLAAHGAQGDWARLFAKGEGFLGTELFRAAETPACFVTIDRWRSAADFEAFKARFRDAYDALDRSLEDLTVDEVRLGVLSA